MESNRLDPKEALKNKAFAKTKPNAEDFEKFKVNLSKLIDQINESESEEFHKNLVSDFLKNTYYGQRHFINTKGRYDLVIHNEMDAKSSVRVILETKKPSGNSAEMPRVSDLNKKAVQQLLLYFLQERFNHRNLDIKYLIVTNIYEWFIFDAKIFEKLFAEDRELVRKFTDFEKGQLSGDKTVFFHKEIAKPAIASVIDQIKFTYFDLRDYQSQELGKGLKPLVSVSKPLIIDRDKEQKLIDLYKLFSPGYLLKLPFANDSNSLNKPFYNELLYIIGLTETKEGGKKLIGRPKEGDRHRGSLIENAIHQLDSLGKISQLRKPEEFGENDPDKLFNVALRLAITWINRVLFLKLLEAQLIKYHRGDQAFSFLNLTKVKDYHDLNRLFFDVLAREQEKREAKVGAIFSNVPYLNSSLFEPTDIEQQTIVISNLRNESLPIFGATVLADGQGKRRSGELNALEYLFAFLDAYDFSSDGSEDDQEDSEKLINASVLGLIFEKINGYKDGSFYTPSFITMYMCRETIRRAVVQKFNEVKGWNCENLDQLYEKITDKREANLIINSLKICDPAVGSGHFLVSALNEMIAIKSELKVLGDRAGKSLRDYEVRVQNDKLVVRDDEGKLFEYFPKNKEKQRVQEALFHEKQTIIEGCLFGVDINPNSVIICRLRLWIELLKNAYYRADGNLETLPNIDINIKCGNSLISRFALDVDVKQVLKKHNFTIEQYRNAVQTYRNAVSKEQKQEMERLIRDIKGSFTMTLQGIDPNKTKLRNLEGELYQLENQVLLFEESAKEKKAREKKINKLNNEIDKLRAEIEDIESGKIYENALEWRFEFPEVLNDKGDFIGFDIVIGNPPYGVKFNVKEKALFLSRYNSIDDIYTIFIEQGEKISKKSGFISLIVPISWLTGESYFSTRSNILENLNLDVGITLPYNIFIDAYVDTGIYLFSKNKNTVAYVYEFGIKEKIDYSILTNLKFLTLYKSEWSDTENLKIVFNPVSRLLNNKINSFNTKFEDITDSGRGILANPEDYSKHQLNNQYENIFIGKLDRYYIDNKDFQCIKYGENLREKPASFDFFMGERILVRRIVNRQLRIMATLTDERFVTKKDIYTFKSNNKNFPIKYLLAVINSTLISFIKTTGSTSAKKDDFTQLTLNDIRQLRIPEVNSRQIKSFENLVDQILTAKKFDPKADTTALEKAIDQLVYQLYGLTEEEIKIVEGEKK
ncbi:MAG: type II restriction endonuclease [Snowella sp.]|nr:MAG: type II restriction endonuclease [Snowella sp.]